MISSNIFSGSFSLSLFSCWEPKNANVGVFNVVPRSQTIFLSFHSFSFLLFHGSDFHHSVSNSLFFCLTFCYLFLLVNFSDFVLFISVCFFNYSSSLLNISYIFFVCASILFPMSWITFTIITPNSFSSKLPISNFLRCSSRVLLLHSSGTYSSAISFSLIFCDCGFHSTGCRTVLVVSVVFPRWMKLSKNFVRLGLVLVH